MGPKIFTSGQDVLSCINQYTHTRQVHISIVALKVRWKVQCVIEHSHMRSHEYDNSAGTQLAACLCGAAAACPLSSSSLCLSVHTLIAICFNSTGLPWIRPWTGSSCLTQTLVPGHRWSTWQSECNNVSVICLIYRLLALHSINIFLQRSFVSISIKALTVFALHIQPYFCWYLYIVSDFIHERKKTFSVCVKCNKWPVVLIYWFSHWLDLNNKCRFKMLL